MHPGNLDDVIFSATLRPHRSLGRRGMALIVGAIAGLSFSVGAYVWWLGAWPVIGFVGLDVAAVALAFHLNARSARAYEEVEVSRAGTVVRRVAANGRSHEFRFNPQWVRLEVEEAEDEGVVRIALRARDRHVRVGAFLNPDDRASFAHALNAALQAARI